MRGEVFNIAEASGAPCRADLLGVSDQIYHGQKTTLTISVIDCGATLLAPACAEERWSLLLQGSGMCIEAGEETFVVSGALWRTPALAPLRFRAGPDGARVIRFCATPRVSLAREYDRFGELPPGAT